MFMVVFGNYDAVSRQATVRSVQFNMKPDFTFEGNIKTQTFAQSNMPDYPHFGHTDAFNLHVMQGLGKEYLPKSLEVFHVKKTIQDVTRADAESIAIGFIEAAKQTSAIVPDLLGIGGAVDAYLLDASGKQKIR